MPNKKLKVVGPASPEEVESAYKSTSDKYERERLLAIKLGQTCQYTLEGIGAIIGRGRTTVALWVKAFRSGGIPLLLARRKDEKRSSRLTVENKAVLILGLQEGRWKTGCEIHAFLQDQGCTLSLKTIYYWIHRLGGRLKVPRKSHVKKTSRRLSHSNTP
jgi:transposase